jgi:hypothetical protein
LLTLVVSFIAESRDLNQEPRTKYGVPVIAELPGVKKRKSYTKAFKEEGARLLEHSGKPAADPARELGLRRSPLYYIPLVCLLSGVFGFTWFLMWRLASSPTLTTIQLHILFSKALVDGSVFVPGLGYYGQVLVPHLGFFQAAAGFHYLLGISIKNACFLTLSIASTLTALVIFVILRRQLLTTSRAVILSFTAILMIVGPIYLPFFNKSVYFGQGSPSTWHNATVIAVKAFALMAFYLTMTLLDVPRFRRTLFIAATAATFLSAYIKPTFVMAFFPALGIYLVLWFPKDWRLYGRLLLLSLPTLVLLIWQYRFFPAMGRSITVGFLTVWRMYTPNVFISILLVLAFPLSVLAFRFRELRTNGPLMVAWLMTLVGIGYFALIVETARSGHLLESGNWIGPYLMALTMLFVTSVVEFLKGLNQVGPSRPIWRFKISIQSLLLVLHVYGGIIYLFELIRDYEAHYVLY